MSSSGAITQIANLTARARNAFLASFDHVVFDCDGVLWQGSRSIDGAARAVQELRASGKTVHFLTNNSTQSREAYVKKFAKFGIDVKAAEIVGSAFATAQLLRTAGLRSKKLYVVGEQGLCEELEAAGFAVSGLEDNGKVFDVDSFDAESLDDDVAAVVVGMDRGMNYLKVAKAAALIRYRNARFFATNTDTSFPIRPGQLAPGAGAGLAAITATLGRGPDDVAGKPSPSLHTLLQTACGVVPSRALMVGDRLNTDIRFATTGGMLSLLVLTGVSSLQDAARAGVEERPMYSAASVADLARAVEAGREAADSTPAQAEL